MEEEEEEAVEDVPAGCGTYVYLPVPCLLV